MNQPVAEYTVHSEGISFAVDRALAARIKLFSDELAGTTDSATRVLLQRILFNLSLSLVLAALRGRASDRSYSLALARRTAGRTASLQAALWTAAFAFDQLRTRTRRLFA